MLVIQTKRRCSDSPHWLPSPWLPLLWEATRVSQRARAHTSRSRVTLPTTAAKDPSLNQASETSEERVSARARATAEDPDLVVAAAMVAAPTTLDTEEFSVLAASAVTAESSADTVLTAPSHPKALQLASVLDQNHVASALDSVELVEA